MRSNMLSARDLNKKYGDFAALSGVSFEIRPGEIFGYLGPNGAGKSTTLKLLTFASAPDSGEIMYEGRSIFDISNEYKNILGYVPEVPFVYEMLTGREFLNFVCDMRNIPVSERKKIDHYLDIFEIFKDAEKIISCYSNGMRKKISIIAAIMHGPKILLLDEPTSAMDALSTKKFKDILAELKNSSTAILLTTHVLEIAEKLCQRIAIINKGKMLAEGTPEEIKKAGNCSGGELEDAFILLTNPEIKSGEGSGR